MDPSEPALKPQWLKSQNGGANGNATSNSYSNGISNANRLTSIPGDGLRTRDKDRPGKSKAYSSFGTRSNRNHNRNRKQEMETDFFDRDSSLVFDRFNSLLDIGFDKDQLRRSRSLIPAPVTETCPEKKAIDVKNGNSSMDGTTLKNVFLSNKEFPSLKTNGIIETGRRVSSQIERISKESVAKNGGEVWNSVLAEVPLTAGTIGSGAKKLDANGPGKETINGLNMAQAVAQPPSRTTSQLTVDPQKVDELTIRQCKQLIPLTPSSNKNLIARSTEKSKSKGITPLTVSKAGAQPLIPSPRASLKPETVTKPISRLGTFQILNREKNGTVISAPPPTKLNQINTDTTVSTPLAKSKSTVSKQAKDRLEFFNSLRSKKSSHGTDSVAETGSDSSPTADDNASDEVKSENDEMNSENGVCDDKDRCEGSKWDQQADEEVSCQELLDPEEEAFLRSLGWDANAEIDALTKEEIDAFNLKYKERKQFSMVSQQKILSMG